MTTPPSTRDRIITILSHLAAAYGGASQYDISDVGTALYRQRRSMLLDGSDSDLANIAADIMADDWSWTDETRDETLQQILDAMAWEAAEDAEKAETEIRRQARRPAILSPTHADYQREVCRKIVTNLQTAIGAGMEAHPRIVGMALASAIEDGDAENYPEALADHCSSVIWPTRHEDGFPATMETACLQWIQEAAEACKASL
jgi:hypothetical protein